MDSFSIPERRKQDLATLKVLIKAGFEETGMDASGVNYLRVRD